MPVVSDDSDHKPIPEDDCITCSKWPEKDGWAHRENYENIRVAKSIKCLQSLGIRAEPWTARSNSRTNFAPFALSHCFARSV